MPLIDRVNKANKEAKKNYSTRKDVRNTIAKLLAYKSRDEKMEIVTETAIKGLLDFLTMDATGR